jgi:predicted branched-subunit amino acid permease
VVPAFFLMLVLDELRKSPRAIVAAMVGAGIAAALLFVTSPGNALLGATAAALIGAVHGRRPPAQRSARSS